MLQRQAAQSGHGQQGSLGVTLAHFFDAGRDVAADRQYLQVRPQREHLGLAPQAARSHPRPGRQLFKARAGGETKASSGDFALGDRRQA